MLDLVEFVKKLVPGIVSEKVYSFKHDGTLYLVMYFALEMDEETVSLCMTSNECGKVFLSVTDGDPKQISLLLAYLAYYNNHKKPLGIGHTFRPDSKYLNDNGKEGLVFMPANILPLLSDIPMKSNIGGCQIQFLITVFLNSKDFEIKEKYGLDGLLNHLSDDQRDIIQLVE